ncbi:Flp pilus assembly protein CpaB [Fodinisporobacter ferrooxydans]|uniref:Flp pilus assembly protein CpaB n=1 Tax=Fodinisporobacter ferrooxydans TaxID=2901836 RepID=A0ABY4CLY1_9BACL|nr:Flp pilus assembly protein CpaB [Alicyclobacillaceae bacterium MYW30-H2]
MKTRSLWLLSGAFACIATFALYSAMFLHTDKHETTKQTKAIPAASATVPIHKNNPKPFAIQQGKRAMSVAVNDVQGVSGFLAPGDYVDVVAMIPPSQGENSSSQILLQNIKVLAVGMIKGEKDPKAATAAAYKTVTLEVLPGQGASLALALQKGSVALMLRSQEDHSIDPGKIVTLDQLHKGEIPK